jgi:hypothetical protein
LIQYYNILGIDSTATLDEIKKAYRRKAKLYHPDKNKAPEAEQNFIEVTEAYNVLVGYRTQGYSRQLRASTNKAKTKEDFFKEQKARARQKAREYANMKYEEFLQSEGNQTQEAMAVVLFHVLFATSLFVVIGLPIILLYTYEDDGFMMSLLILLVTAPLTNYIFKERQDLGYDNLKEALKYLIKGYVFFYFVLSFLNLVLLFRIGFQTLIPTNTLLLLYPSIALITQIFFRKKNRTNQIGEKYFRSLCLAPFILNLFLLINYVISFNPQQETYRFTKGRENLYDSHAHYQGSHNTSMIYLSNNVYEPYWGIRVFASYEKVCSGYEIHYTFKTGLFGIRVMKDYHF